jgi:hypothetical protein
MGYFMCVCVCLSQPKPSHSHPTYVSVLERNNYIYDGGYRLDIVISRNINQDDEGCRSVYVDCARAGFEPPCEAQVVAIYYLANDGVQWKMHFQCAVRHGVHNHLPPLSDVSVM